MEWMKMDNFEITPELKQSVDKLESTVDCLLIYIKGGSGSGNFDHGGRPGHVGGSGEGGGSKREIAPIVLRMTRGLENLSNEDIQVVRHTLNDFNQEFPDAIKRIDGVSASTRFFEDPKREVAFVEDFGRLTINPDYAKIVPNLIRRGMLPTDADLTYIVNHELGHVLYYNHEQLLYSKMKELNNDESHFGNFDLPLLTDNSGSNREIFADLFAFRQTKRSIPKEYDPILKIIDSLAHKSNE
jgi:hypothetical protein